MLAGLEGGRRFQLVRFLFCFSFSIQISHNCSSSVATVARVHGGLRRGRAAALRPLNEVAARLGGVPAAVDKGGSAARGDGRDC